MSDQPPSPATPPSDDALPHQVQEAFDEWIKDGVPLLVNLLTAISETVSLEPVLEAVLFGVIGKYSVTLREISKESDVEPAEAHHYAMLEVMRDPRVSALVQSSLSDSTDQRLLSMFGGTLDDLA